MSTNSCSGGAAAAVSPITFLGFPEQDLKALHLAPPEKICLTFPLTSTAVYPSIEDIINRRIPDFPHQTVFSPESKKLKVIVTFKRPENIERAKGLLKTLEIPFTDKGKTSNRKPEVSVVQPKKSDRKDESGTHLQKFPLGMFGNEFLGLGSPMVEGSHVFLHPDLLIIFKQTWKLDPDKATNQWGDLVRIKVYECSLSGTSYCVPHPYNPESQRQILKMQLPGLHTDFLKNWTHSETLWFPKDILSTPGYWLPDFRPSCPISKRDSGPLISSPQASISSRYPVFNLEIFRESLGGKVDISDPPQGQMPFWLKEEVALELFHTNSSGEITGDLKVIFAQMIYASAFRIRKSIEMIPGIMGEVSPPDHLLIMHPNGYANRFVNKIPGCTYFGEVQIPWQLTRMDGVFFHFRMSPSSSYGGGGFN